MADAVPAGSEPARRRRPQQARARETVARILDAARTILLDEGPKALTTNRIAAISGVGVGSIYEYFGNKEAICRRLIDGLSDRESAALIEAFARYEGQPLAAVVDGIVAEVFALYREHAALYQALDTVIHRGRGNVGMRPSEQLVLAAIRDRLHAAPERLAVADPVLAADVIFHVVEALAHRAERDDAQTPPAVLAAEAAALVRRYLGLG